MRNKNDKLKILIITPEDKKVIFDPLVAEWEKYFNIKVTFDKPTKIGKYTNTSVDLLFLYDDKGKTFELEFYDSFQKANTHFKYVLMKDHYEDTDYMFFKFLADAIVYTEIEKDAKWHTVAILRRYWRTYSKPTTIIYKSIIADFVDNKVTVNGEYIDLTKKEMKLLKLFMHKIGEFTSKNEIFKQVWGFEEDTSRTLDQMIFKLKKKIGKEYIHSSRTKGFKFE